MELPVQFGNKVKILIHESYVLSATPEDVIPNNKKWTYNLEQNYLEKTIYFSGLL
jgi:hypothetical protein